MPFAPRLASSTLSRLAVLIALTFGLLGATAGIASADPTPPAGSTTDPGTVAPDPVTPTLPTITFTLPAMGSAVTANRSSARSAVQAAHTVEVDAVLRVARAQHGKPYVYGGSGPRSFDCSGLVRYVFGHAIGRWLPHNAAAQYHAVEHVKRRNLQVGDLVFQESGGYPFHVGIYAGHDKWWHAPHTGAVVREQKIYRGHLYYGRVLTAHMARAHTK